MAPTSEQITVALDALRADAAGWDRAADDLRAAAAAALARPVPPAAFSFAGQAVAASYEALRAKTAALLDDGARNFDDIAGALRATATSYAADEAAGAHRIQGVY